jgi:hypothetical protein
MKNRFQLLLTSFVSCVRAEPEAVEIAAEAPDFIRVEETETATHLQTAVVRFTKGEASVELVGAVHIADKKYYEALNQRFEGYEALLFEGIGGDQPAAAPAAVGEAPAEEPAEPEVAEEAPAEEAPVEEVPAPKKPAKKKEKLDGLHGAYESGAKWLGLAYQMKVIDYRKANFVHADLSMAEFTALQKERGETLLGFVLKSGLKKTDKPVKEPSSLKLLVSLVRGDKDGLKRELVHTLGAGDDQVAALADTLAEFKTSIKTIVGEAALGSDASEQLLSLTCLGALWRKSVSLASELDRLRARIEEDVVENTRAAPQRAGVDEVGLHSGPPGRHPRRQQGAAQALRRAGRPRRPRLRGRRLLRARRDLSQV